MRKIFLGLLLVALAAATAVADEISGQIRMAYEGSSYGPYQAGIGGEFTYSPINGWLDLSDYASSTSGIGVEGTFQSFCIEYNEHIYAYPNLYEATISKNAYMGGGGSGTDGDPISVGTGWLYSQFAAGTLQGYAYVDNPATAINERKVSADYLQKAIWWLEDEYGDYSDSNPFMAAVVNFFGNSEDAAKADGGWNYGVYALNFEASSGDLRQDTLYYRAVPDGGATVILLGFAVAGMALVSRRFRV